MKKLYFLLTFLAATAFSAMAVNSYNWAFSIGAGQNDQIHDMETDEDGNIYICGSFGGNANFGSRKMKSDGFIDGFVAKFSKDRKVLWLKHVGSIDTVEVTDLTVDEKGNVYAAGYYLTDFTVYQTSGDTTTQKGNISRRRDLFAIALDSDGKFLEVTNAGSAEDFVPSSIISTWDGGVYFSYTTIDSLTGDINSGIVRSDFNDFSIWETVFIGFSVQEFKDLGVTADGKIVALGYFAGNGLITDEIGNNIPINVTGFRDLVIAVLESADGEVLETGTLENGNDVIGWSLDVEGSSLYIGAFYTGTFNGVPTGAVGAFNSIIGRVELDLTNVDAPFDVTWWNNVTGNNTTIVVDVAATKHGLTTCGHYFGTLALDTFSRTRLGTDAEGFGAVLDKTTGEMKQLHQMGGVNSRDIVTAVAGSNLSYIVSGTFDDRITMGALGQNSKGLMDGFMTEIDLSGRYLAVKDEIFNKCEREDFDIEYDLFGDYEDDNVFIVEMSVDAPFNNPIVMDTIKTPGEGTVNLQMDERHVGSAYLVRVRSTNPKGISNLGVRVIVTKGAKTPKITGKIKVKEGKTEGYMVNANAGSTYKWSVDGGTLINGVGPNAISVLWGKDGIGSVSCIETNSTDCPSAAGILEVEIDFPESIATTLPNTVRVYPTLVSDQVIIENTGFEPINAILINTTGQELATAQNVNTNAVIDMGHLAAGVYMMKVQIGQQAYSVRVIKD